MKNKKWMGAGLAITMAAVTLIGCSNGDKEPAKGADTGKLDVKQEITLPITGDIPSMDISKATDDIAFTIQAAVNEGLTRLDKNGKAQPGMATDWDVSDDGLTYTFKLRDAKWANGEPVTAKDFVYSWKRTLDPKTKASYSFMVAWIKGGEAYNTEKGSADDVAVKAVDDKTLEVTLAHPVPFFVEQMAFPVFFPQNQKFVEAAGDKYSTEADKLLANGPFKMSEWAHEQSATLVKNDQYWDKDKVKLTKATFQVVKDSTAAVNLYESGELDRTIGLVRDQVESYKDSKEFSVEAELTAGYVMYNQRVPALTNAKIRQALTYAIDAEAYADVVYHNGSKAATGIVPNGVNVKDGEYRQIAGDLVGRKDNAAKAKDLLAEGLKEAGLTEFPKIKLTANDDDTNKKGAEFVQEQWRSKLGIEVEVETLPFKLRLDRARKHDFDLMLAVWGADYNDPMTFLDLWMSDSGFNYPSWKNADYDKLIKQAQAEPDAKKRTSLMVDAEKLLMKEMPIGPTFFRGQAYLTKSHVKNWQTSVFGPDYDLKETYIQGKE
ncbi:peptide ABC transporter substrate-binding protein [Tumebacillus sp. DT12]|uniref:Peptide ABC transporter substrate-binding protein n=1 Tax=Tumebacillus lacus TaxID=2995335 RepID=A0ABT3X6E0_9BACL|nr:peptide ABC transporter substrate-binding protein [Tumebacillus lacus]MCX7571542.1 peptide ABC transporter substrate-binding protein [Tumebacillus lacus]